MTHTPQVFLIGGIYRGLKILGRNLRYPDSADANHPLGFR